MRVVETAVVFQETDAASPTRYSAAPSLLRCPDDTLLLSERVGTHKNSADGTQRMWRSADGGRTWQQQRFPFDRTPAGKPGELRTCALSQIGNGRIAMLLTWVDHPADEPALVNPKTEGLLPIAIAWADSSDSGRTWGPLRDIPVTPLEQPCGNGPIVRLPDGSLLAGFETYKHYDDPAPWSARSAHVISRDDGHTWEPPRITAEDPEHNVCYWDHHVHRLRDGTLLDALWADDRRRPGISDVMTSVSRDSGATWSRPAHIGISGQYSSILQLPDGRLLMFYVVRTGNPSIYARLGSADGTRWDADNVLTVYSQAGDDLARTRDKSFGDYLQDMGAWTFGWPSPVLIGEREVLVAHYKAQDPFCATRVVRIEL